MRAGTTKMIKSVINNVAEVAQAIGRPPTYLITYLGQVSSLLFFSRERDREGKREREREREKERERGQQCLSGGAPCAPARERVL